MGDALGAPIEFHSWDQIAERHGPGGVTTILAPGHFTDDTQLTLFTCEGLVRARLAGMDPVAAVRLAYLRWLHTQGESSQVAVELDGWLVADRRMHRREAPGIATTSALRAGGPGTTDSPVNDSKGCGGAMRAAPCGFFVEGHDPEAAYGLGCDVAAITHGHPDGWHSAGAHAAIVHELLHGTDLTAAVATARELTSPHLRDVLDRAVSLAGGGLPAPETIERCLGGGWVGDEALAIAVCCALAAGDFEAGVIAAVNHSGDTDSTGSICGNILGAALGVEAIRPSWLTALDARDIVEAMADDVTQVLAAGPATGWADRYPRP